MKLHNLLPPYGEKNKKRRVGRGNSSGRGNYSGRGLTGEGSRSGRVHYPGFEGGQMPLYRRLPKRGFTPLSKQRHQEVNLYSLNIFKNEKEITPEILYREGLIANKDGKVKILGGGEIKLILTVKAHKFSKRAKEEITQKGGSAVEICKKLKLEKVAAEGKEEKIQKKKAEKSDVEKSAQLEKKAEVKEEKKAEEKRILKKEETVKAKKKVKNTEKDKIKITKTKGKKKSKPH